MKAVQQIKPFAVKVFVEDTDFQGFVYHANYLKFFERARSQFLNDLGFFQSEDKEGFFRSERYFYHIYAACKT